MPQLRKDLVTPFDDPINQKTKKHYLAFEKEIICFSLLFFKISLYSYLTYLTPFKFFQVKQISNCPVTVNFFTFKCVNVYYRKKKQYLLLVCLSFGIRSFTSDNFLFFMSTKITNIIEPSRKSSESFDIFVFRIHCLVITSKL